MKLLDKKEVLQAKNLTRETEINEGAKLARKIDALRETAALEEKKLAEFREKTLNIIKEEVDVLILRRNKLREEIHTLEKTLLDNYK